MHSKRTRKGSTNGTTRRFVVATAVAVLMAVALLPGSGLGASGAAASRAQAGIRAGLARAIHARFGAATLRASSAAQYCGRSLPWNRGRRVGGRNDCARRRARRWRRPGGGLHFSRCRCRILDVERYADRDSEEYALREGLTSGTPLRFRADGTTAFVGAPVVGSGDLPAGAIYVFHVSAEDAWSSTSKPKATLTDNHSLLVGRVLALSSDGTTLVAGDEFYKFPVGGAFVFHVSSEDAWASTSHSDRHPEQQQLR